MIFTPWRTPFRLLAFSAGFAMHALHASPPAAGPTVFPPLATTWEEADKRLKPLPGIQKSSPISESLDGKVIAGYQGWFFAQGDGSGRGWVHYGPGTFKPGISTIDLWPDMTEAGSDEQYPTEFTHSDGSTATVFSSYHPKTVARHFKWMADYGIDGAFLQRFGTNLRSPQPCDAVNAVMDNVRHAAAENGRTWAIMYDLSGLNKGEIESVVENDWKKLVDRTRMTSEPNYQRHRGKPLVIIWGIGFGDKRQYTLEECNQLVDFLKTDPTYGGNSVMLGIPYYWLAQTGDSTVDPKFHSLLEKADIISPWSIGRYRTLPEFQEKITNVVGRDQVWCAGKKVDYMPVIFPGFQWKNLMIHRNKNPESSLISREGGDFYWQQGVSHIKSGARMLYLAMFDEVDEGTAIFKVSNNPPVGESAFGTYGNRPPDHYLWLSGQLSKALREKTVPSETQPVR